MWHIRSQVKVRWQRFGLFLLFSNVKMSHIEPSTWYGLQPYTFFIVTYQFIINRLIRPIIKWVRNEMLSYTTLNPVKKNLLVTSACYRHRNIISDRDRSRSILSFITASSPVSFLFFFLTQGLSAERSHGAALPAWRCSVLNTWVHTSIGNRVYSGGVPVSEEYTRKLLSQKPHTRM